MKPIAICAIFRDEAPYLLEWIAYHSIIGFDRFVLYDNKSQDGAAHLLRASPYASSITIVEWPREPGQLAAYQHYVDTFRESFEWTAFLDVDEFIHIINGDGLKDLLRSYDGFSAILLQWLMFGPSGWEERPAGLVIENYTLRMPEDAGGNLHVKSLVRNAAIVQAGETPHTVRVSGPVCNARGEPCPNRAIQELPCHDRIVINHYFTKSKQDWLAKLQRGKATSIKPDEQYPSVMFEHVTASARVGDERLARCAPALHAALALHSLGGGGMPPHAHENTSTDILTEAPRQAPSPPPLSYPDMANPDLLRLIPTDAMIVLDVGCGTGALGAEYRKQNPKARLLGIERNPDAAAIASGRLDCVLEADVEAVHLPADWTMPMDCIVYGDVLQQLRNPWSVVQEHLAYLKPGGTILICVPNVEHRSIATRLFLGRWKYEAIGLLDIAHLRWFTLSNLKRELENLGLTIKEMQPRVFKQHQADSFRTALDPALANLGISKDDYDRRASPLQYVLRCVRSTDRDAPEPTSTPRSSPVFTDSGAGSGLASHPVVRRPCVLHNKPGGAYANLMIKYMVGLKLKELVPNLILSNFPLPYWGIDHQLLPPRDGDITVEATEEQRVDVQRLAYLALSGLIHRIEWTGYGQRMENFPNLDACRKVFSFEPTDALGQAFDNRYLVCPIRGGEVLDARHGGYTLLPVEFYRELADTLGLQPVFMGQISDNLYVDALRRTIPDALYVPTAGPLADFQTIRKARNIVVSVSTFSWLAAWLSEAEQIHLPVYGLFNPKQFPQNDLLPLADTRYRFYEFPVHWAVPVERVLETHRQIAGQWPISPASKFIRA